MRLLDDTITFEWTPSVDPEGRSVTYSLQILDTEIVAGITALSYSISANDFSPGNTYTGLVIARDESGKESRSDFDFTTNRPAHFAISTKYDGYTAKQFVWNRATLPDTTKVWYDIYINGVLFKTQKDTSLVIRQREIPGRSAMLQIVAKSSNPFTAYADKQLHFWPELVVSAAQMGMRIYNISDKSVNVFLTRSLSFIQYQNFLLAPHQLYIDGVQQFSTYCGSAGPRQYPQIVGLAPNTTYTARYQFSYPDSFNPEYEQISKHVYVEKTFTTSATPITSQFDQIDVTNVTATSAALSWRIQVEEESCYVPVGSAFYIYLNGVHWSTLPHTATGVVLENLNLNT
ncbi:MAG TPA: hypothetical protein VGD65_19355 [Chryseosolibacter sp.]